MAHHEHVNHKHTHDSEHDHDHAADHEHEGDHDHIDLTNATKLRSIGIDIGSATSHFVVSDIFVGKRDPVLSQKPEVLKRQLVYQSPILFTPFRDQTTIDAKELERFLVEQCSRANLNLEAMDTGALICTGEAARKENAAAISESLSMMSGKFVCATAGHHLEAMLGAYGSGSVLLSQTVAGPVVSLDAGGGTAKRTLMSEGKVLHTSALNIGARLIAWDQDGKVNHLDHAGTIVARDIGLDPELGKSLDETEQQAIADRMADCLIEFIGFEPMGKLAQGLFLTETPPPPLSSQFSLTMTGGLSEYFYGRETSSKGDLGLWMSQALRRKLLQRIPESAILTPENGIRATVIGAGQFSIQVSGETIWMDSNLKPPLRNIPVYTVPLDWTDLRPQSVHETLSLVMGRVDPQEICGLAFSKAPYFGYGIVYQLAEALAYSFKKLARNRGLVFVFHENFGRAAGHTFSRLMPDLPVLCVDEIEVGDLDYLDIGEPPAGDDFLPVVVKSLVFS